MTESLRTTTATHKQPIRLRPWQPTPAMAQFMDEWANWSGLQTICLTSDIDFVPDYMLAHQLDLFDEAGVCATFFATHETPLLDRIRQCDRYELALHPFNSPHSTQGESFGAILDHLGTFCDGAEGNRFHKLTFGYPDLQSLASRGVRYDASTLLFNSPFLLPSYHSDLDMVLVPYPWEDGTCEATALPMRLGSVELESPGLKILTFHPLNVYINAPDPAGRLRMLTECGPLPQVPESRAATYRLGGDGSQRVLQELLDLIARRSVRTACLADLARAYRAAAAG